MSAAKSPIGLFDEIKPVLEQNGLSVYPYSDIPYGIQFRVNGPDCSGTMRIFQNKKGVLKIDYSQIKGRDAILVQKCFESSSLQVPLEASLPSIELPIIGSDESGKGDYFGPLVAAAVYVDKKTGEALVNCGVRDSKDLSQSRIADLAISIPKIVRGKFAVVEISPEKYNELYRKFVSENKNLNVLLAWGHAKAIEVVLSMVECKQALADQFADERFILSKLQERGRKIDLHQMPKAEKNVAVAAASILARHRFVSRLAELSNRFGIELPKGTSQQTVSAAKTFVNIHGRDMLGKVAKLHFKTTDKVLN